MNSLFSLPDSEIWWVGTGHILQNGLDCVSSISPFITLSPTRYFVRHTQSMEKIFLELILPKPHDISTPKNCFALQHIQMWCPNYKLASFAIPAEWKSNRENISKEILIAPKMLQLEEISGHCLCEKWRMRLQHIIASTALKLVQKYAHSMGNIFCMLNKNWQKMYMPTLSVCSWLPKASLLSNRLCSFGLWEWWHLGISISKYN